MEIEYSEGLKVSMFLVCLNYALLVEETGPSHSMHHALLDYF